MLVVASNSVLGAVVLGDSWVSWFLVCVQMRYWAMGVIFLGCWDC